MVVSMENKNKLSEIALLRVFATFSIVIWHTYCSYICWGIAESPANSFYKLFFIRIFPCANKPLFTFIAGYLFCYLLKEKGKYQNFRDFLKNKTHRLLIPFLVLGTIINLCEYGKNIVDILYGLPNHLWYCLMLFYVFVACWLVEKKNSRINILLMIFSFALVAYGFSYLYRFPLGLFQPVYFFGYFYVGFLFREKFETKILKSKIALGVIFCGYVVSCIFYNRHMVLPLALTQIILLFAAAKWFCNLQFYSKNEPLQKTIDIFSKYSFGIYVLHQWIIWNLTREPHLLSYVKPLLEQHYISAPIIMSTSIFLLCFALTHILCKTKAGRYFLL